MGKLKNKIRQLSDADTIEERIKELEKKLVTTENLFISNKNSTDKKVDGLNNNLDTTDKKVEVLSSSLDTTDKKVDGLSNNIDSMDKKVDELSNSLDTTDKKVEVLNNSLDSTDKKVEALNNNLDTTEKKVDGLSKNLDLMYKKIDDLSKNFDFKIESVINTTEKQLTAKSAENLSELDKEKIARKMQVKHINEISDILMKQIYIGEEYVRERITLNEEDDRPLSEKELEEINRFWKPYLFAYKNNPETQRVYSRVSGKFDPSYITYHLQFKILNTFWEAADGGTFRQISLYKNLIALMFPQVHMPQTYVIYGWGQYYDRDRNVISKDDAVDILYHVLENGEKVLIKPSDGTFGNGIRVLETCFSKEDIAHTLNEYSEDFLCQQFIENHPSHSICKSLNTLRIITLYYKGKLSWVGTMFRMGVTSDLVDNLHSGGIACPVDENGICGNYAFSLYGKKYYEHPNGFKFAGHKLYNYEKAHELALTLHKNLPFVKYISWDIAIDKTGEPVVLEFLTPGATNGIQLSGYNIYLNKETMKEILDECLIHKFFYRKAIFDWDYREYISNIALTKYAGVDTIVKVPENIDGKRVTYIDALAITDTRIQEIYIPKSIRLAEKAIFIPNVKIIRV